MNRTRKNLIFINSRFLKKFNENGVLFNGSDRLFFKIYICSGKSYIGALNTSPNQGITV
ncbi:MAG: hypothetical protein BWY67_00215 [Bacteroidetes bacterium ADurb.Bin397]|nr:MAG: hypothetical protein BWY67_00215 [Bacteroidetes bacterium ADurb.Bin397]